MTLTRKSIEINKIKLIGQVFTSKHHDSTPSSGFMIFNAGIHGGYSCSQSNGHNITYISGCGHFCFSALAAWDMSHQCEKRDLQ